MHGLWYEELEVGVRRETATRTISDEDIRNFAALSGDVNPLHLDDDYAAATPFGGRVAHGVLGLAVATGLLNRTRLTAGTLVALSGIEWRFRAPIRPGESVRAVIEVIERRLVSEPGRGLVRLRLELRRGDGLVVQDGVLTVLVRCRDG